ncbi:alpha-amylase-like [Sitophilus oryzae]|uniref:Alpha-amylase n=1 Tax=Sitophilus oryzae TaxID=7048 RepID=A0A6J2XVJ9_SITOR|nr:alpha-amylase-like [Sitophilus oryzae]
MKVLALLVTVWFSLASAQKDPHFWDGRNTIVHLFEWKWSDIASECENFLSVKNFAGVQVSPPAESVVVEGRPWWEKYQPVSYTLNNRGGDEAAFTDMVSRCNKVGIRIYVDLVANHMATSNGQGSAGNTCDPGSKSYPAVSYTSENFHTSCDIDYTDASSIRNCELTGLKDLDQSQDYVRGKIEEYMNHLISLGVAGFRVDAAKHMWPADLQAIFGSLNDLNTDHGFASGARAFIFQEVIDTSTGPVKNTEYTGFGKVCEFLFGNDLGPSFRGENALHNLKNWGTEWGLLDGGDTVSFVDNHDNERDSQIFLHYTNDKPYKAAIAFMLAHPYDTTTRVLSSYKFDSSDQGPPSNGDDILSPEFGSDGACTNGWVCQHRWSPVFNMVEFRNVVSGTELTNWWDNGSQQIAFSRGDKGFYAATVNEDIATSISTGLPDGSYCDVMSGSLVNGACTGKTLTVSGGQVYVELGGAELEAAVAIHVNAKL